MDKEMREKELVFLDPNIARKRKIMQSQQQENTDGSPMISWIEFNLCGLCNRKCFFCPRYDSNISPNINEHLDVEIYRKIMIELKEIGFKGNILYSAKCEPLLYKYLKEVLQLSKQYCPEVRVEMVSNGDLLNHENLKMVFEAGLTSLGISLYDGPHQVEPFKKMQKEAGLNDDQFILRPRWLPPEEHYGITLCNRGGAKEMKEIGVVVPQDPIDKPCYLPFYSLLVEYDGCVYLCAHDWVKKLLIGDLKKQSIMEIWNGEKLKQIRLKLAKGDRSFIPCDKCSAVGVLLGEDYCNLWMNYYGK